MFSIFRSDPLKKLRKQYNQKLEQAMLAQRKGDMAAFASLSEEADGLWQQIQQTEAQSKAE